MVTRAAQATQLARGRAGQSPDSPWLTQPYLVSPGTCWIGVATGTAGGVGGLGL